ncbi:hypothetical protein [Streptomyces sp. NRRL F-5135]|uniref:hypothetical protein n=1 Tax=Streptomyces sp. NRRL F-5135 TaxID=1463858 RepID=UPI0004C67363|nr:hypothetical protein [Streptomyces sp. NRRL F-5135]
MITPAHQLTAPALGSTSTGAAGPDAPTDASTGAVGPEGTDRVLAERCQSSGDYLAGLIAAATLDHAGQPGKLPELLWPDAEPWLVRAVWNAALAVGYRAGRMSVRPEWTPEALARLRAQFADAGYQTMARHVARTANLHRPVHPADTEVVRDGGSR